MATTINVPVDREHTHLEPPESYFVPATYIYESAEGLTLAAELPGVRPDGLEVTVEENVLVIRGRPQAAAPIVGEVLLQEFASGEFYRAFQLPADYDTSKIEATLKEGVLTLKLPKSERMKPRRIEVKEG
jgi:HSP20 family protein